MVFEDTAAVIGVIIALAAVWLQHKLDKPWIDGAGATLIGLLMTGVATFLIYEIRGLLVGERAMPEELDEIKKIIEQDEDVETLQTLRTMHFGPDTILVAARTRFRQAMDANAIVQAVNRLHRVLKQKRRDVKYVYIEPADNDKDPDNEQA